MTLRVGPRVDRGCRPGSVRAARVDRVPEPTTRRAAATVARSPRSRASGPARVHRAGRGRAAGEGIAVGSTRPRDRNAPAIPSRGSPSTRPEQRQAAEGQTRARLSGMGVEDAQEHDVEKEALSAPLELSQIAVLEVGRHDAGVVSPVPRPRRGSAMNAIQTRDRGRGHAPPRPPERATASHPSRSRRSFMARHQGLPGDSPSSGREHAAVCLPAHERHRGPAKWEVARGSPRGTPVGGRRQRHSRHRVFADRRHLSGGLAAAS